jgi:hypothetical protein
MKDSIKIRIILAISTLIVILGVSMIILAAKSAHAETEETPCRHGDSTSTCLALLNQKAGDQDNHLKSTDKNVDDIITELKDINKTLTELKEDAGWERAIWGTIIALLGGGIIINISLKNRGGSQVGKSNENKQDGSILHLR